MAEIEEEYHDSTVFLKVQAGQISFILLNFKGNQLCQSAQRLLPTLCGHGPAAPELCK